MSNPYDRPSDPAKRHSAALTDGPDRAPARAMLKAIGFDDDFIYGQMPLAPERRSIRMDSLLRDEAQKAFQAWAVKPDKVKY